MDDIYPLIKQIGSHIVDPPKYFPQHGKGYYALFFEDNQGIKYDIVHEERKSVKITDMDYIDLGFTKELEDKSVENSFKSFSYARVILEHKDRYIIKTPHKEYEAELIGNLRFAAESRYDLPAVGDWVAFNEYDEGKALIHAVYPRKSLLERKAVGSSSQVQIIASNIDCGLIVQSVDRDFNLNRLERYITICNSSSVEAVVVLSKIDLIDQEELNSIKSQITNRIPEVKILSVSSERGNYKMIDDFLQVGKTYCLLGSSGVGKSTLINSIQGKEEMKTSEISSSVNKGKHTTTHRELIVLNNGGIIIDNPGMREIGITSSSEGLEQTYNSILEYAEDCRYKDCTHSHEEGCAVIQALENGDIDQRAYSNYIKMEKEKTHFESNAQERKKKDKDLGKMIRDVKKVRKQNKY